MIRCLAIDDEPLALKQLVSYIGKVPFLELAGSCMSAAEAAAILEKESVDAMFLDINMPDLSGLDFVKSLVSPPIVVFTTAYSEYAVEGYKVDAVDYLLKPFSLADFERAAEKVRHCFELLQASASVSYLLVKSSPTSKAKTKQNGNVTYTTSSLMTHTHSTIWMTRVLSSVT